MNKESGHTALDEIRSQWRLMTVYERFEQVAHHAFGRHRVGNCDFADSVDSAGVHTARHGCAESTGS